MTSIRQIQAVYYTVEFLNWLAVALPLPLLILLMQARGLDLFQIGLLSGFYSLTIVLLELPTGGMADAIGRKPVTLLSYAVSLLASVTFLVSFSFSWFAIAWMLLGVSRALSSGALNAWFIDSLLALDAKLDLQPPLAHAGTFTILGLSLGTLLGGIIPQLFPNLATEGTAIFSPLSMTIVFAIFIKLVNTIVLIVFVKEQPNTPIGDTKSGLGGIPSIVRDAFVQTRKNPIILLLFAASFCSVLVLTGIETFWQPHFAQWLGATENSFVFGLTMTGAFVVGIFGNLLSIPLSKVMRKRYGFVAALFQSLAGVAVILLALQQDVIFGIGFFWLFYFMNAGLESPIATILNNEIPSGRRSSMQSVLSLASYAGAFFGSVTLGWLAEYQSISIAWLLGGSLLVASGLFLITAERLRFNG